MANHHYLVLDECRFQTIFLEGSCLIGRIDLWAIVSVVRERVPFSSVFILWVVVSAVARALMSSSALTTKLVAIDTATTESFIFLFGHKPSA